MLPDMGIVVGVITGTAGLVLGILNYIHLRDSTSPRLRIAPGIMDIFSKGPNGLTAESVRGVCIYQIDNVGSLPVMCNTIGFLPSRGKSKQGVLIVDVHPLDGGSWPRELLPGHNVLLRVPKEEIEVLVVNQEIGAAYVNTATGETFTASKKRMQKFREQLIRVRKRHSTEQMHPQPD